MERKNFRLIAMFLIWGVVFSFNSFAQHKLQPEIISPTIGERIDASENQTFKIFSSVPKFSVARFYSKSPDSYYLHVYSQSETINKVVIIKLSLTNFINLKNKILKRIEQFKANDKADENFIYTIEENDWHDLVGQQKIRLVDGNELVGEVVQVKNDTLMLHTSANLTVKIPDVSIESIRAVRNRVAEGKFYRIDPNSSRLFFAPTGRNLPKGAGYFADYYIFFPTVAYGFNDYFACAVGMSIIPGVDSQLFYLAPKLTFPLQNNLGVSTGMLLMKVPEESEAVKLGYVVATVGDRFKGITFGAGFPLLSKGENNPIILLGGELQVSNRAKLLSENWIFTGGDGFALWSAGVRFFGDRLAVDLVLITAKEFWEESSGFPFIPYVDFSVMFGK